MNSAKSSLRLLPRLYPSWQNHAEWRRQADNGGRAHSRAESRWYDRLRAEGTRRYHTILLGRL